MQWMDEVAGIAALRHSGAMVTTAACDNLQFKKGAYINELLVIISRLTYVGRTSMEVRVDVYVEDQDTGIRHPINRAYFTEVCTPVRYGLELLTEAERAEWEGAQKRIEVRKKRRSEGF